MYGPLKLLLTLVQPDEKPDLLFHQSGFLMWIWGSKSFSMHPYCLLSNNYDLKKKKEKKSKFTINLEGIRSENQNFGLTFSVVKLPCLFFITTFSWATVHLKLIRLLKTSMKVDVFHTGNKYTSAAMHSTQMKYSTSIKLHDWKAEKYFSAWYSCKLDLVFESLLAHSLTLGLNHAGYGP